MGAMAESPARGLKHAPPPSVVSRFRSASMFTVGMIESISREPRNVLFNLCSQVQPMLLHENGDQRRPDLAIAKSLGRGIGGAIGLNLLQLD